MTAPVAPEDNIWVSATRNRTGQMNLIKRDNSEAPTWMTTKSGSAASTTGSGTSRSRPPSLSRSKSVWSSRPEKLNKCLLTNAVMLELCDFARTVTESEKYFMFEMLEFNFDLGVDGGDDLVCYDYATRVHNKIKQLREQIKMKP